MRDNEIVRFDHVHHSFGDVVAVENFELTVSAGERVAILGSTGAGKSTVLNLLIGSLNPTSGQVRVDGLDPYRQHKQLQGRIGMAYQSPRLLPWRSAKKNVAVGLDILGVPKAERLDKATEWLGKMHLTDAAEQYPSQLSGGMRQRVSLARAFAIDPAFLLLDESFSALDEVTAQVLRGDFVELAEQENKTAVIVTHDIEEAFAIAHRVIVLGRPATILEEYVASEMPDVRSPEFGAVRQNIHNMMLAQVSDIPVKG